jgi:hypothetical protein
MKMRLMYTVKINYTDGTVADHWYTFEEKEAFEVARDVQNECPNSVVEVSKAMSY